MQFYLSFRFDVGCHPEQREPLDCWPEGKSKDLAVFLINFLRRMLRFTQHDMKRCGKQLYYLLK